MALRISGSLPASLAEGSRAGDWFGLLQVSTDRGSIASIEAVGTGADYVSLVWNPITGTLTVTPGIVTDYEAFLAAGLAPALRFSLRATTTTGVVDQDSPVLTIAVTDRDDTPPSGLSFASGGSVFAGAIGAVIGTLRVTDPDTPSDSFRFSFPEDEAWRFEVVDGLTLKLREGITLGLDDIPSRPLLIGVSDGSQDAAFVLDLAVLDPGMLQPQARMLAVGEARGTLALPAPDRALVLAPSDALVDIAPPVDGETVILLRSEADAGLPETTARIDFLDARLVLPGQSSAAVAVALAATPAGQAQALAGIDKGLALLHLALPALAMSGGASAAAPASALGPDLLALRDGRLGSGESPAQVALDLVLMQGGAGTEPAWLPLSPGRDLPLPDAALAAPVVAPGFHLDALMV